MRGGGIPYPLILGGGTLGQGVTAATYKRLHLNGGIDMDPLDEGPSFSDAAHVGGFCVRSTVEAAIDYGFVFRSPGGYLFEDVPSDSITWRFIISSNGNSNFGMANSTTKSPQSKLEVTGNFIVGSESWTGDAAQVAPTNGVSIEGALLVGIRAAGAIGGAKIEAHGTTTRIMAVGTGVTSAGFSIVTNSGLRWEATVPSGQTYLLFADGSGNESMRLGASSAIGFLGAAAVVRQTSGANLTNNVTSGGTNDTIADFTDLTTYSNSAAAIRNNIYQLARKLKQVNDALRTYGLLT